MSQASDMVLRGIQQSNAKLGTIANFIDPAIYSATIQGNTAESVAQQQAAAQQAIAQTQAGATRYTSDQARAAAEYQAQQQLQGILGSAQLGKEQALGVAQTQAGASMYGSDAAKAAQLGTASMAADAARYGADQQRAWEQYTAEQASKASMYGSEQSAGATKFSAEQAAHASMYGAEQQAGASKYATDQTSARYQQALNLSNERFGQIWPYVQSQIGGLGGTSGGPGGTGVAGAGQYYTPTSAAPSITAGGVYSPTQVQAGKNKAFSDATKNYLSTGRDIASGLASRGIGQTYQSPLTQAMMGYNAAQGIATGAANAQQFEQNAAQANASQLLNSQQAVFAAWKGLQDLQLQAQQNKYNYSSALLNSLLGYAGTSIPNPS